MTRPARLPRRLKTGHDMHRRRYRSLLPHCAIPMSCTDEDGGVVPILRTTREARWRTFVQPS